MRRAGLNLSGEDGDMLEKDVPVCGHETAAIYSSRRSGQHSDHVIWTINGGDMMGCVMSPSPSLSLKEIVSYVSSLQLEKSVNQRMLRWMAMQHRRELRLCMCKREHDANTL